MKIDKKIITNLREEYGDAFYLLDSEQFQKNFIELRDTFRSIYPNFNIAYSYKTNYTPKFCKLVDKMGGYAEVVSEMEMEIALRCGVKHNRIIWNGPIKNSQKLEEFLVAGGIDNVDCIEELDIIKGIAKRHPRYSRRWSAIAWRSWGDPAAEDASASVAADSSDSVLRTVFAQVA